MLGAQERAGEVYRECVGPTRFGHTRAGAALAQCARIVEGDIEPAEALDRQGDQRFGVILRANVAGKGYCLAVGGTDFRYELIELLLTPCAEDELRTLFGEQQGGFATDARTGTRDHCNFSAQAFHGISRFKVPLKWDVVWCSLLAAGSGPRAMLLSGISEQC